jgi:hypothetical protein
MLKAVVVLGLLTTGFYQSGKDVLAVPTLITANPVAFGRGQLVSLSATFKQPQTACPVMKNRSQGFQVRIYDAKDVYGEPTWTVEQSKTTKIIASTNATAGPVSSDDNKKVQRDFEPISIPQNAPERIYVTVWRACSGEQLVQPQAHSIYKPVLFAKLTGGQFYKFSCPGSGKIATGKCGYQKE